MWTLRARNFAPREKPDLDPQRGGLIFSRELSQLAWLHGRVIRKVPAPGINRAGVRAFFI
jgi:hypothetical protein